MRAKGKMHRDESSDDGTVLKNAQLKLRVAREQYFTALAFQQTRRGVRTLWKIIEPVLTDASVKRRLFSVLVIVVASAWKKGYQARRDKTLSPGPDDAFVDEELGHDGA